MAQSDIEFKDPGARLFALPQANVLKSLRTANAERQFIHLL